VLGRAYFPIVFKREDLKFGSPHFPERQKMFWNVLRMLWMLISSEQMFNKWDRIERIGVRCWLFSIFNLNSSMFVSSQRSMNFQDELYIHSIRSFTRTAVSGG
jgi:hypothetical protein